VRAREVTPKLTFSAQQGLCNSGVERWRVVPIDAMQIHANKRVMCSQRIEKRTDTVDVERLVLGTELTFKESGVDEYCVFHIKVPSRRQGRTHLHWSCGTAYFDEVS